MSLKKFLLLLCVLPLSSISKEILVPFAVSSYIDKDGLYPYSLSVSLSPAEVELKYDEKEKKFFDKKINVLINSDVPNEQVDIGFGYNLNLILNESQCNNYIDGVFHSKNIMNLFIDGNTFDINNPALEQHLEDADSNGFLSATNELLLVSNVFEDDMLDCRGSILIEAELTL